MNECRWCGETHTKGICPNVKAIEFAEDGETVRRVEFLTPMDRMPMNGWQLGVAQYAPPYVPQFTAQPPPRWATMGAKS